MKQALDEVIDLQREYSSDNTPKMIQRGMLIRRSIPREFNDIGAELRNALGPAGNDAEAEGGDGAGLKAMVPWVRWYSKSRSPSAQVGWYIVYLFHPDAEGVSLCLSHGSTILQNGSFVGRSGTEVAELMSWAARVVGNEFRDDPAVRRSVKLGSRPLAQAYERTTVFSKFYPRGQVPGDDKLRTDLLRFCEPLRKLYDAQDRGIAPGAPHPDVIAAQIDIDKVTAPLKQPGQGRGLSGPERKVIELRAMRLATQWLRTEGFEYNDVSARDSCDFRAKRGGEDWVIEVKGTTGGPGSVLLTRNEVELHRLAHPRNALLIVHDIELTRGVPPNATGGMVRALSPWQVLDERLEPLCYQYRLDD